MDSHLGIASLAATEFGIITCMYAAQAGHVRGHESDYSIFSLSRPMLLSRSGRS